MRTALFPPSQLDLPAFIVLTACTIVGSLFPLSVSATYCTPTYSFGTTGADFIDGVSLGTINLSGTGAVGGPAYTDRSYTGTGTMTRLTLGSTYTINITAGSYNAGASSSFEAFAVWIDYNADGIFAPIEKIGEVQTTAPFEVASLTFTLPTYITYWGLHVPRGYTGFRVRNVWNTTAIDPCANYGYGETEDMIVLLEDAYHCLPLSVYGTSDGDYIDRVQLNGMDAPSGGIGHAYTDMIQGASIIENLSYTVSVTGGSYAGDHIGVWVDKNGDHDWNDAGEHLGTQQTSSAFQVLSFNYAQPVGTVSYVRMRVRSVFSGASMTACSDAVYSETEDYTIAVQKQRVPCLPLMGGGLKAGHQLVSVVDPTGFSHAHGLPEQWPYWIWWNHWATTPFVQGATQNFQLNLGTAVPARYHIYLDMTSDGDFDDPGEDLATGTSTSVMQSITVPVSIPANCPLGEHWFRVRIHPEAEHPLGSCEASTHGNTFDMRFPIIAPNGPCVPNTFESGNATDFVNGVQLGAINNQNTGKDLSDYSDFTHLATTLTAGSSQTIFLTGGASNNTYYRAWIDYNADGDWNDANENIGQAAISVPFQVLSLPFTVPVGTGNGPKRMRIVCANGSFPTAPCAALNAGETEDYTVIIGDAVRLLARVMLEGPYNTGTGLMSDALRTTGLIPPVEPYTGLGFTQSGGGGGEGVTQLTLAITGADAVVDWALVELRSSSNPASILYTRCALLQRDGDIVEVDGHSPLVFLAPEGDYFVSIRHRNHLGAMTQTAIHLSIAPALLDMSSPATTTHGVNARKDMSGVQVLWAGNVQLDDRLKYTGSNNDRDRILTRIGGIVPTNTVDGYFTDDVNLDGTVKYTGMGNDRDPILVNIGGVIPTNMRLEQLP